MDYKEKYLYYKQKYLLLKNGQKGGGKKLCIIFNNKYNMKERDRFPKVYFLNFLTKRLEENGYEIILLKEDYPNEIKKIMETKNIDLILYPSLDKVVLQLLHCCTACGNACLS